MRTEGNKAKRPKPEARVARQVLSYEQEATTPDRCAFVVKTGAAVGVKKAKGEGKYFRLLPFALCLLSCSFTFIPFAPRPLEIPPAIIIGNDSVLSRSQDSIVLRVKLTKVPNEGYLSASLYLKTDRTEKRIAEDSKLITSASSELVFTFPEAKIGQYRAYLFWQGSIVRQFEFVLK